MNQSRINILFLAVAPLVFGLALGAQTMGTLTGTINDNAGAAVPAAAITVTPLSGGPPQRVVTGTDGTFAITGLPPGSYRVDVEYSGYKRSAVQNIELTTGAPVQIRVDLQRGDTRDTVQVRGSAVLTQTDSAQISQSLNIRTVTEIPLFERNHQELVQLLPGITPPHTMGSVLLDPQRNRLWETNGLPSQFNRRNMDGVENDEPNQALSVYVSPVESIQQLDLMTSNYSASQGRAGGTIINPATRTGSNEFHGSAFEFNSVSAMSARNYFNPEGVPQARYTFNQFGATLGGPIKRDNAFFMLSYAGDLDLRHVPTITTVPTADFRAGNFSAVPQLALFDPRTGFVNNMGRTPFFNNTIPTTRISPVARALLPFFPTPNAEGFENNLFTNVPLKNDGHRGDVRLDHKFEDDTNFFLRWSFANYSTMEGSPLGALGGGTGHLQNHNAMIGATHVFSPSIIGDLRLSYTRYANKLNSTLGNDVNLRNLGFTDPTVAGLGIPQIQINGMQSFGTRPGFPGLNVNDSLNLVNSWNLITGRNNVHFGFDVWGIRADGFENMAFGPTAGYVFGPGATASPTGQGLGPYGAYANSFAAFLLGAPTQAGRTMAGIRSSYTSTQGSLYLEDSFKVSDKLTLELGGRWDVFSPVAPRRNEGIFIYNPATNQLSPTNTGDIDNVGNVQTNWKNVAPRFGFAYRAMERTVVRGGYGITFFQGPLSFYAASLLSNPGTTSGVASGFGTASGTFGTLPTVTTNLTSASSIVAPNSTLYYTPRDMRTPYVQQFNLLIEQDLGRYGLVGSIGYVGNVGRFLPYSRDINAAQPGAGVNGLPLNTVQFARTGSTIETGTGVNSNYNSLQANLTKRFGQSLSFTAAYTYSKALDYGSNGLTPFQNNLNLRSNYGPADWDRTHMFTFSHNWQIPIGADTHFLNQGWIGRILGPWQLSGVFRWNSGTPITLTADPTLCNCIGNTPTASTVVTGLSTVVVPVPTFFGFVPVPYQSLQFEFTQPAANSLGNLGRNSVRGPGFTNYDVSLHRSFVVHEQTRLELRGEAFNITNSPHFANPIGNVSSASFGQSISTLPFAPERKLQVAARILF